MAFPARTEASCCADLPVVFLGTDATTTLVARLRWEGIGVVGKPFTCNLSSSRAGPAGDTLVRPGARRAATTLESYSARACTNVHMRVSTHVRAGSVRCGRAPAPIK
jgi:hypothetical protein